MNIRRIIFILGALLVVALASLAYQFLSLQRAAAKLEQAYDTRTQSLDLAVETYMISDELTRAARTYVATGDSKYEDQYNLIVAIRDGTGERPLDYPHLYWALVNGGVEAPREMSGVAKPIQQMYKEAGFTEKEIALLNRSVENSRELINREVQAFYAVKGQYQDALGNYSVLDAPDRELALSLLFGKEYHKLKFGVMKPIDEFVDLMRTRMGENIQSASDAQKQARLLFTILLVLSLLLTSAVALAVREQNRRELMERTAAQEKAEKENEQLNDSVISILQAVNQISQRDLTVQAPVTEDVIGTVSDSINALTGETARVLHGVTDIAGQVAAVSGNVKNQAEHVTRTAEEERQNVGQMVESLLDATQTMNQVAALAEQSNESAEEATQVTDNALGTVNDTVKGMESIRETIAETEKRIKRLGERSQEISGIVNLINTISERTHVLALNASMQAAVAGEAGRGFAVVAEEVQRLAESSRNATQQIATLVNNIQIETNETINTVNRTIGQVVEGSEQAQKAGEQMRLTQQITNQLVNQVRSISDASVRQKEMSATLLGAVQRIGESTEQTAQQIEAQNRETQTLQEAAAQLVESVGVFKLPQRIA